MRPISEKISAPIPQTNPCGDAPVAARTIVCGWIHIPSGKIKTKPLRAKYLSLILVLTCFSLAAQESSEKTGVDMRNEDEFKYYQKEELQDLTFTKKQLKEDAAILGEILQYLHPAVYKYRDSAMLQADLEQLEREL